MLLFLSPVYVPLALLQGWIHAVAKLNPFTLLLEEGRGLLAGAPLHTASAFLIAFALVGFFAVWSLRGLRSAERAG